MLHEFIDDWEGCARYLAALDVLLDRAAPSDAHTAEGADHHHVHPGRPGRPTVSGRSEQHAELPENRRPVAGREPGACFITKDDTASAELGMTFLVLDKMPVIIGRPNTGKHAFPDAIRDLLAAGRRPLPPPPDDWRRLWVQRGSLEALNAAQKPIREPYQEPPTA